MKGDRDTENDPEYRKFKKQLYHSSISAILQPLKAGMTTPVIRRCPDGHFRRIIYDLAVYIADYPEQVLLAGVVYNWCPKYVYSSKYYAFVWLIIISWAVGASGPQTIWTLGGNEELVK